MKKTDQLHQQFHDVLGHLTTIKAAGSVLVEDYSKVLPDEVKQMVSAINQHTQALIEKIEKLREAVYQQLK